MIIAFFLSQKHDLTIIYTFHFQGKRLEENVTEGVILGNQTLVLQSVELAAAGLYTCVASNTVADGESNALHLDIKCKFILDLQSIGSSPVLTNIKHKMCSKILRLIRHYS